MYKKEGGRVAILGEQIGFGGGEVEYRSLLWMSHGHLNFLPKKKKQKVNPN